MSLKLEERVALLEAIEILKFSELANTSYQNLILEHKALAKKRIDFNSRSISIDSQFR